MNWCTAVVACVLIGIAAAVLTGAPTAFIPWGVAAFVSGCCLVASTPNLLDALRRRLAPRRNAYDGD